MFLHLQAYKAIIHSPPPVRAETTGGSVHVESDIYSGVLHIGADILRGCVPEYDTETSSATLH